MFTVVDIKFIAIATMIVCFLKGSDGEIHNTPPEVIYPLVGSKVVLSWCISPKDFGFPPTVTFYLKNPPGPDITKRAIATVASSGERTILPSGSTITHFFSPNQLQVIVSNCTVDGKSEHQLNYTLVITNLTVTQSRIYKFQANYGVTILDKSETKLIIIEPPSQPKITCTFGEVTSNKITVKEGDKLNCSCSATGGIPAPHVYWEFPGKKKNNSKLIRDGILRNEKGTYTCIASNKADDTAAKLEVDVQYLELTCDVSLRGDNKVVFKTKAIGNPKVHCHPLSCINETIVTKDNVNQAQFANNSVGSDSCNKTVLIDKKLKCGFSSDKEIGYVLVSDEENTNFILFLKKNPDMSEFIRLDWNLSAKGNELFWPNNTKYVLEKETNNTIRNYFKSLCSGGSGVLIAPTLISFLLLVFLLVINE